MLECQSEVDFFHINIRGEFLAHQAGFVAWPGGEETCIYVFAPGIDDGNKSGLLKELYEDREFVYVVINVCKTI